MSVVASILEANAALLRFVLTFRIFSEGGKESHLGVCMCGSRKVDKFGPCTTQVTCGTEKHRGQGVLEVSSFDEANTLHTHFWTVCQSTIDHGEARVELHGR